MTKKSNRFLAMMLVIAMCFTFIGITPVKSNAISYSGSSSYMSGKYYTALTNVTLTGSQRTDILNVAKSQVGYLEGDNSSQHAGTYAGSGNYTEYGQWYSDNVASGLNGQAWCSMFVSWCANVAGISSDTVLYHSYTETQQNFFEDRGQSYTRATVAAGGYTPQPGDIIFFCSASGLANGRDVNHVGIVSGYSNGVVYTVEGNTSTTEFTVNGGCVANKSYSISDTKIRYICSPSYTGGAASGETGSTKSVSSISELSSSVGVTNKLTADISGNLTIQGDTYVIDLAGHKWTNSGNAIVLATGTLYVYDSVGGGSIVTSANDAVNMGNGSAKFEDITITGGGDGMDAIYCSGGNLTVENCTLSAPKAGINVANDSEAHEAEARSVVTVNGGKFANYSGTKDSQGRNCAIEIRNNADEITLTGSITFENNKIISKSSNTKSIKDAITATATYTAGNNVSDYVVATINYGSSDSGNTDDPGNTDSTNEISSLSALSGVEGVVNKLTADVSGSITLEGETYVIDLAGHKWTNSGNAVILATGSLYVYDSVGGGSIETTANDAINMGNGTAKFENITIKGGGDGMDAIYCDGGNLTVINCTLSAPKAGINVANGSESSDASARSVVTVNGGKFANYSGTKDSQGRNCAIEIRNNADEITLTGNITFENNKIISKKTNTKSIKDSITTSGTITSGSDVADYVTATISFGSTTPVDPNPVDPNPGVTNPDLIAGDVNGDKSLNGKDALQLRRYITGGWDLTVIEQLLDINCDENVNGKDVVTLRRFLTGGYDIEIEVPGQSGSTDNPGDNNPGDNDNPGDSGNTATDTVINIEGLPTAGTFTAAGYGANEYVLNVATGGTNDSTKHSIGIINLANYKEIKVTYGNDGSASEIGDLFLKTSAGDLLSIPLTPAGGWKTTTTASFDVSALTNNEELFLELLPSASNGIVITKIELIANGSSSGDNDNTGDNGNTGDNDNTGTGDSAVVGTQIDISSLANSGSFTAAGFDASQKFLNFQSGGDNSSTSHSIGKVDLSKYKEIIVTFSNDASLSGQEVATVVLKTSSTDLTSAVFTGSNGWNATSTATFDVSSLNNNEELFMALASANGGFAVSKIELVPINGSTGDSGNTGDGENTGDGGNTGDSGNTGTVTNGEIILSSLSNAGTFTAAGYGANEAVLNMATGGTNDSLKQSIGTHDLSKYNMLKVTYGTSSGISSVGTLNLKDASGNVIASVTLKPAGGWKATTVAELDVSKSSYNGALTLELTNQSNGVVVTKLVLSSAKADSAVNISSLATSGAFTAAGYSNKILNFYTGGTNDSGNHSIGSHNLAGYNVLKVTYGTDASVSTAGTLKLKDASGNVIASVAAPGSAGWKATRTVELDISNSTYNGNLTLELADAKGGMAVTEVVLSADKADMDLTIKNLSTSGTFTASGMSADKYVLNFYTGGQNDSGKHAIGTHSLDGYNSIFVTYSTGAVSSIGTLQLVDAAGNVISSVKLSPSGGWLLNSRAKLDVSGSTYSGALYLKASSDVTNGFAISAITFSSKDTLAQSGSIGDIIIQNAQLVSDFARTHGFTYGHATYNPGMNWASLNINSPAFSGERITSCDRFVDWVLYRSGFTQGQKQAHGHVVFEMEGWLSSIGFTKITDVSKLQKGDVVFTNYDPTRPGTPAHVFICASSNLGGNVYLRYDHGSNARIQCTLGSAVTPGKQPYREVISDFYYAYRPYELN